MAKSKGTARTSAERMEERKLQFRAYRITMWVPVALTAVKWTGAVACAYFAYRSVDSLAGLTTDANFGLRLLASKYAAHAIMALFGAGGVGYGMRQRKLRRDSVERLSPRAEKLEALIDRRRSSSKLTTRGDTNPKDAL